MDKDEFQELIAELRTRSQEWKTVDAKRELVLHENGDKAEFVKDILAMANNGERSFIVIGLEDGVFESIGKLKYHYNKNTLNQILADKTDPPVIVDYKEYLLDGNEYAVIEINGDNPPYVVARDFSANKTDRKQTRIYKGNIFVRHEDRTEGISRAELDEFTRRKKPYVTVGFEQVQNPHKSPDNVVTIRLYISNEGPGTAQNIQAIFWFDGCKLLSCPSFKHGHTFTHVRNQDGEITENKHQKESLVVNVPLIHFNAGDQVGIFSLILTKKRHQRIGLTLKGGNIDSRDVFIDLKKISQEYQTW